MHDDVTHNFTAANVLKQINFISKLISLKFRTIGPDKHRSINDNTNNTINGQRPIMVEYPVEGGVRVNYVKWKPKFQSFSRQLVKSYDIFEFLFLFIPTPSYTRVRHEVLVKRRRMGQCQVKSGRFPYLFLAKAPVPGP